MAFWGARSQSWQANFEPEINSLGGPFSRLSFSQIAFASFSLGALLAFFELNSLGHSPKILLFASFSIILPPALAYSFLSYKRSAKQRSIDEELPSVLFQMASAPNGTPFEKMICDAGEQGGSGVLTREFSMACNALRAGSSVPEALSLIADANSSRLLRRSLHTIRICYESGAPLGKPLKEIAEGIFDLQSVSSEGESAKAMQKYTLLVGGAVLVPSILALLLGMVSSFDYSSLPLSNSASKGILPAVVLAAQIYLSAFSAIASLFLGLQEGNIKKAVIYFSIVAPLSLFLFDAVGKVRLS